MIFGESSRISYSLVWSFSHHMSLCLSVVIGSFVDYLYVIVSCLIMIMMMMMIIIIMIIIIIIIIIIYFQF